MISSFLFVESAKMKQDLKTSFNVDCSIDVSCFISLIALVFGLKDLRSACVNGDIKNKSSNFFTHDARNVSVSVKQFPVMPRFFSLTGHKTQGQTMDSIVIHLPDDPSH